MTGERFEYRPDGLRQIDSDDADPFGHRDYAAAVVAALNSLPPHFTLGLFGPWGSGKSTILEEVRRRITAQDAEVTSGFVLFDAWRYDGDSLRREFLKASARSLNEQRALDKRVVNELNESLDIDQTNPEKPAMRLFDPDLYKRAGVAAVMVGAIILAAIFGLPHVGLEQETILAFLLAISSALAAFGLLALQPVVAPTPTQKTRRRAEFPDEFSAAFRKLLDRAKVQRLVFAIDNLDRCSPGRVTETLATIKTFLEPAFEEAEAGNRGQLKQLCFVVAADDTALRRHLTAQELNASAMVIAEDEKDSSEGELPQEVRDSVDEYLRKFFGASIRLREVLDEDISRFCEEEFAGFFAARPELDEEMQRDLVEMTSQALKRNPRRIVQFVNNLALRLEVLEERQRRERILIEPEVLFVAKLAILEEEFPEAFSELQDTPQMLDVWQIEANSSDDTGHDNEPDIPGRKTEKERLEDFLRFTDDISSRHLRAYLDLKQNRDELELDRYADLIDFLDGGDVAGVRTLLEEVHRETPRYVSAIARHFGRHMRRGNWGKAHNTLRAVTEIAVLHGENGVIAARLLGDSLSHPGLTRRLPLLNPGAVLEAGGRYLNARKFNQLVLALGAGMNDPSDSEARKRIADAIAKHGDALTLDTERELGVVLRAEEVGSDVRSYVQLAENVPGVAGTAIGVTALEKLEGVVSEERGGDGPELRVAVSSISHTLERDQFVTLVELGQAMLERLQEDGNDDYSRVARRLRTLVRVASATAEKEGKQLPGSDERTAFAEMLTNNLVSIPDGSQWETLQLGYELCQVDDAADAKCGFALGQKVLAVKVPDGVSQWLENELKNMPKRFGEAVHEALAYALAGSGTTLSPRNAARSIERLSDDEQRAITTRAINIAVEEGRSERVDDLLATLPPDDAREIVAPIAQRFLDNPGEIMSSNEETSFLWSHQELIDDDDVFKLGMGLAEAVDGQRGKAAELGALIEKLKIRSAEQRLELVQRLLRIEADMSTVDRKIAMLSAAIGAAGKRQSHARGAAIGRLRERLGADNAAISNAAKEMLASEGESE